MMKLFLSAIALFSLLSCARQAEAPPPGERPIPVRAVRVPLREERIVVRASGLIASRAQVNLAFKVGGIIERMTAREGDFVRKETLLATLNQTEIRARAEQARAGFDRAERDLRVSEGLYPDSAVTEDQLIQARNAHRNARASLEIAEHNLRFSSILAPSDGRVLRRLGEPGEMIEAGRPLFVFASEDGGAVLRAGVADRDIVRLSLGDSAAVAFDAHPGQTVPALLTELAGGANPLTGLYEVELAIGDGHPPLLPGMAGHARILTRQVERLPAVPVESLVDADADRGHVYVLDGETVRKRLVTLGRVVGREVLAARGLLEGEIVVVEGAAYLRDNVRVKVIAPSPRSPKD
jgi:RND family efflux transporter MFP subunit